MRLGSKPLTCLSLHLRLPAASRHLPPADTGYDVDTFFRAVHTLSRVGTQVFEKLPQLRFGYLHGALVMYLGHVTKRERLKDPSWPRAADWAWIHKVVCQDDYYEKRGKFRPLYNDPAYDVRDMHFCYHGIGHAFIYHSYFHPTDAVCFEPPPLSRISNLTLLYEAHRMCMSASTDYYRQACAFGVYHSYSEWTFGWAGSDYRQPDERGVLQQSIFFPCDAMPPGGGERLESAMCFEQVFRWLGWNGWVFDAIRTHVLGSAAVLGSGGGTRGTGTGGSGSGGEGRGGNGLVSLCLANPGAPHMEEGSVQSCIVGMSEVFYNLFDKFTAARSEADLQTAPMRERCCTAADDTFCRPSARDTFSTRPRWGDDMISSYSISLYDPYEADYFNMSTYTVPRAHCELLWEGHVLPPAHVQNTLVEWCSNFVAADVRTGERPLDAREWRRYLACTKGAFINLISSGHATFQPMDALSRVCPQLLDTPSWVPPTLRRLAYEACEYRFHTEGEPRETRYSKLDDVAHAAWIAL